MVIMFSVCPVNSSTAQLPSSETGIPRETHQASRNSMNSAKTITTRTNPCRPLRTSRFIRSRTSTDRSPQVTKR